MKNAAKKTAPVTKPTTKPAAKPAAPAKKAHKLTLVPKPAAPKAEAKKMKASKAMTPRQFADEMYYAGYEVAEHATEALSKAIIAAIKKLGEVKNADSLKAKAKKLHVPAWKLTTEKGRIYIALGDGKATRLPLPTDPRPAVPALSGAPHWTKYSMEQLEQRTAALNLLSNMKPKGTKADAARYAELMRPVKKSA